jgi:hypothetical protein
MGKGPPYRQTTPGPCRSRRVPRRCCRSRLLEELLPTLQQLQQKGEPSQDIIESAIQSYSSRPGGPTTSGSLPSNHLRKVSLQRLYFQGPVPLLEARPSARTREKGTQSRSDTRTKRSLRSQHRSCSRRSARPSSKLHRCAACPAETYRCE